MTLTDTGPQARPTRRTRVGPDVRQGDVPRPRPGLRVLPVPQWDPVLADDPHGTDGRGGIAPVVAGPGQQVLPLTFALPNGLPAEPAPVLTVLPAPRRPLLDDEDDGPARTARRDLPDPQLWAGRLAQAVVEVCGGDRPVSQLLRWTSHEVYLALAAQHRPRARVTSRPGSPGSNVRVLRQRCDQVRSVHLCEPADGVAEASAVVAGTTRWWALALRLEGLNGRWVLTSVDFV